MSLPVALEYVPDEHGAQVVVPATHALVRICFTGISAGFESPVPAALEYDPDGHLEHTVAPEIAQTIGAVLG